MRSANAHILWWFILGVGLVPAPKLSATARPDDAIAACALVEAAPPPFAGTDPTEGPLPSLSAEIAPGLAGRVSFWREVWSEAGDGVAFVVDERMPEVVHAVVDCGATTPKAVCDREIQGTLRDVRATLSSRGHDDRDSVRRRYEAAPRLAKDAAAHVRVVRGRKDALERAIVRAAPYLDTLEDTFEAHGVPRELARLAIVESLFRPTARSRAGAVGAYQFVEKTAQTYLRVDGDVDERLDVLRAGDAAARYLARLRTRLGRYDLAITAYNAGPQRVRNLMKRAGTRDLATLIERADDPRFGFDGQNYAAQVVAAIAASEELWSTTSRVEVGYARLTRDASLASLSRCLDVPVTHLVVANPALKDVVKTGARPIPKGYVVAIPEADAPRVVLRARHDDDGA